MKPHENYELFDEIGRGRGTIVYHGFDLRLERDVAIKVLVDSGDADRRGRLLAEAQFLAQHEHEAIVRVHDVDVQRGWVVMELASATLADLIQRGNSPPDLVRSMLRQALSALQFLHGQGKIHGGIRPTNLLVTATGHVRLSDIAQGDPQEEIRVPNGDQKYLAPELLQPKFGPVSAATDLYILGMLALEMLVGPKLADRLEGVATGSGDLTLAWMRWQGDPTPYPPLQEIVSGVPKDLCDVIDSMLVKPVEGRIASAEEALKQLSDESIVLVPPEARTMTVGDVDELTQVRELAPVTSASFALPESVTADAPAHDESSAKAKPRFQVPSLKGNRQLLQAVAASLMLFMVSGVAVIKMMGGSETQTALESEETEVEEVIEEETASPETEPPEDPVEEPEPEDPPARFQIPTGFEAVAESGIDESTQLPQRIRSTKLSGQSPAEFGLVPTGTYSLGVIEASRMPWERPSSTFTLSQPFYFALTETSVAQYRQFAEQMGEDVAGTTWREAAESWLEVTDSESQDELPVSMVSRQSAKAYAGWLGAQLPNEDEWETGAIVLGGEDAGNIQTFRGNELSPVAVGDEAFQVGRSGAAHVLGNVAEWTTGWDPIARGAGYATAHGDHVRIAWRGQVDPLGQWDVGIRLIVAVQDTVATSSNSGDSETLFAFHHATDGNPVSE